MIYDILLYLGDESLLELRLHELNEVVDKFIILDLSSINNNIEPLNLDNLTIFYFKDKIVYNKFDFDSSIDQQQLSLNIKSFLDSLLLTLDQQSIVILSDSFSIPNKIALKKYKVDLGPRSLQQRLYRSAINSFMGFYAGSKIYPVKDFLDISNIFEAYSKDFPIIKDGGWSFYINSDLNDYKTLPLGMPKLFLFNAISNSNLVQIGHKFPTFIRDNYLKFKDLIKIDIKQFDGLNTYPSINQVQREKIHELMKLVAPLEGSYLQIGAWEGSFSIFLASLISPQELIVLDDWRGLVRQEKDHKSFQVAKKQNVYLHFRNNLRSNAVFNVSPIKSDPYLELLGWNEPVKFVYLNKDSDYTSVVKILKFLLPYIVQGGIICGNNWNSSNKPYLNGGVQRATQSLLRNVNHQGELWWAVNSKFSQFHGRVENDN